MGRRFIALLRCPLCPVLSMVVDSVYMVVSGGFLGGAMIRIVSSDRGLFMSGIVFLSVCVCSQRGASELFSGSFSGKRGVFYYAL